MVEAAMRKRGIYWQARPKAGGKLGKWRSTRCTDQKAAQAVLAEWERELADPAYASKKGATINQAGIRLTQDLISLVNVGKRSEATKSYYFEKLGTLARILGPDRLLVEITAPVVDGFIEARRLEEVTEHTIAKELGVLRVLLKTAKRNGWWSGDLDAVLPHGFGTGAKPRERFLSSLAELGKILRAIGNQDIAAQVAFSVATGAEAQAIRRAQWCDLAERFVAIHGKKRPSRERVVPVVASWQETLLLFVRQNSLSDKAGGNPQLFVHIHGIPKALREACKKLGLPHLCPNDLRRTFNVWMDAAGVPVALRAQAMGHASTKLLEKFTYGRIPPDVLRENMRGYFDGQRGRQVARQTGWDAHGDRRGDAPEEGRENVRGRDLPVRLRHAEGGSSVEHAENDVVRVPTEIETRCGSGQEHGHGIQGVDQHARAVQQSEREIVFGIRGSRDLGVRAVEQLRELPGGHGPEAAAESVAGQDRQQRQLRARKLPMGHGDATTEQPAMLGTVNEQDRRCPVCQNWLDRYGRCLQCAEDATETFNGGGDGTGPGATLVESPAWHESPASTNSVAPAVPNTGLSLVQPVVQVCRSGVRGSPVSVGTLVAVKDAERATEPRRALAPPAISPLVQPVVQVCQSSVTDAGGQGRTELDNSSPANTDSPLEMAPRAGIEPATYGLTVRASTEEKQWPVSKRCDP